MAPMSENPRVSTASPEASAPEMFASDVESFEGWKMRARVLLYARNAM